MLGSAFNLTGCSVHTSYLENCQLNVTDIRSMFLHSNELTSITADVSKKIKTAGVVFDIKVFNYFGAEDNEYLRCFKLLDTLLHLYRH